MLLNITTSIYSRINKDKGRFGNMSLENIMNTNLITVTMDDNLSTIQHLFNNARIHHLLVVENNQLHGVISDRDLLKAVSPYLQTASELPRDTATLNKKAHQIMTRNPITLQPHAGIHTAINFFNSHPISCIPIVDKNNHPVGIISWRDILKFFSRT